MVLFYFLVGDTVHALYVVGLIDNLAFFDSGQHLNIPQGFWGHGERVLIQDHHVAVFARLQGAFDFFVESLVGGVNGDGLQGGQQIHGVFRP